MTAKVSTGLRNAMLVTDSFKGLMDNCKLRIYAGTVPATADAALGGATLLCEVSDDATGDGLIFDASASAGVVTKDGSQIWRGVNVATGVATFYRLEEDTDDGTLSTTALRVQGTVAVAGGGLNLSSVSLVATASQSINFYSLALPTS